MPPRSPRPAGWPAGRSLGAAVLGLTALLGAPVIGPAPEAVAADPGVRTVAVPQPVAGWLADIVAGRITDGWLLAHVDPGPVGWTAERQARWRDVLRPDGPLAQVLAEADDPQAVVQALPAGPDGTHGPAAPAGREVVLLTRPPLALTVHDGAAGGPHLARLEVTTCVRCGPRERFVADLLAEVRRHGRLGTRLLPDHELDLRSHVAADSGDRNGNLAGALAQRHRHDAALVDLLEGAVVAGEERGVVRVRYPDGRVDTWRITRDGGWRVVYGDLAPDSPLRLDADARRAWWRTATAEDAAHEGWQPSWQPVDRGAGVVVGHEAAGFGLSPLDGTVWIAVADLDRTTAGLFHVDPDRRTVDARRGVDMPSRRANLRWEGSWYDALTVAVEPASGRAALAMPGHFDTVLPEGPAVPSPSLRPEPIVALAWGEDDARDTLVVAWADGRVEHGDAVLQAPPDTGVPIAVALDTLGVELVTDRGAVLRQTTDGLTVTHAVCDGDAHGAARRARDGAWWIACGPTARAGAALVPGFRGEATPHGDTPGASRAVAWDASGTRVVTPAPAGHRAALLVLDLLDGTVVAALGRADHPVRTAAFDPGDEHVVGLLEDGTVIRWDLVEARRAGW